MDTRRLLLGDWTPWVRDGLDLIRASLIAGALGYAVAGDAAAAVLLGASAVVAILARVVALPRLYDLALLVALSLQGWGEVLGLYDRFGWFDNVVHFVLPSLIAPVMYIALARLDVVPDPKDESHLQHHIGVFLVTFALGGAVGAVWEVVELSSDGVLGTSLQVDNTDTVTDLLLDLGGALVGAGLLVLWTIRSWGSVRRIPGENRFEDVDA